jgi:deazaflavin-dependent oxidoreductase (nitroreductase family)
MRLQARVGDLGPTIGHPCASRPTRWRTRFGAITPIDPAWSSSVSPSSVPGQPAAVYASEMDQRLARRIARFNRHVTNRLTGPLAPHLPGFAVVTHVGRRSGRTYRTPVNVFWRDDGFVFALTYGPEAQWVENVLAAGRCELTTRGRTYALTDPDVFRDPSRHAAGAVARPLLRLVGTDEFLRMRRTS